MTGRILVGDSRRLLPRLRPQTYHACVTSPPYFGLRDYGCDGQIGLEQTPSEYVAELVDTFREVHRVLRDDGVLWVNLGDSYAGSGKGVWNASAEVKKAAGVKETYSPSVKRHMEASGLPAKSLIGIPWRFAFAMQEAGWILRQDIIWHKPNAMPESVKDRCGKSHEYIFMFVKRQKYFYDHIAVKDPASKGSAGSSFSRGKTGEHQAGRASEKPREESSMRNKRSVWTVPTKAFKGAHFATFPPELIRPCIEASTSEHGCCAACGAPYVRVTEKGAPDLDHQRACGGASDGTYTGSATKDYGAARAQDPSAAKARILAGMAPDITVGWRKTCGCPTETVIPCRVLDPFGGAGTTGVVAGLLGRGYTLLELNPEYAAIARERIAKDVKSAERQRASDAW